MQNMAIKGGQNLAHGLTESGVLFSGKQSYSGTAWLRQRPELWVSNFLRQLRAEMHKINTDSFPSTKAEVNLFYLVFQWRTWTVSKTSSTEFPYFTLTILFYIEHFMLQTT